MNKIYVCLDESGDFMPNSYSKSKSFIGGYACNESFFEKGKEFLELCNEKYEEIDLNKIHCSELMTSEEGRAFVDDFCKSIISEELYIIKTINSPLLCIHPQQVYVDSLIGLMIGILENEKILLKYDEIVFRVSIRSESPISPFIDSEKTDNRDDLKRYHEYLKHQLMEIIGKNIKMPKGKTYNIEMGSARKDYDLIIADLVVGCLSNRKIGEGRQTRINVREFNGRVIGSRGKEVFINLIEQGYEDKALSLAILNFNSDNKKMANYSKGFFEEKFSVYMKNREKAEKIATSISDTLKEQFMQVQYDYKESKKLKGSLEQLYYYITNLDEKQIDLSILKIKESCLYILYQLEFHSGTIKDNKEIIYINEYLKLINNNGSKIFPTILTRYERKLEAILFYSQSKYFNAFNFKQAIDEIIEPLIEYEKTFDTINFENKDDNILARLYGTYAQANAFEYDINRKEENYKTALTYLQKDLEILDRYDFYYQQGISYMISLEWMKNNIDGMLKYILIEFRVDNDKILKKEINEYIKERSKKSINNFMLLDYVRYIWLNYLIKKENGESIETEQIIYNLYDYILQKSNAYPVNLIKKWMAVIMFYCGETGKSIELLKEPIEPLESNGIEDSNIFNIMFPLVNNMIFRLINGDDKLINDEERTNLKKLKEKYDGFNHFCEKKKILEINSKNTTIEQIARLMPFYYS